MAIRKILIVDDSPTERHVLSQILVKHNYQVAIAESGEACIVQTRAEMPDLILMDVVMPGLNGYQATRMISRNKDTRHIPIIICTTKGQDTDKIWGLRQGAKDYIVKPIDAEELLRKIKRFN